MSVQMESRHFLKVRDTVEDMSGQVGHVVEGSALYALIHWDDGGREEVEQFDPRITVIMRAPEPS